MRFVVKTKNDDQWLNKLQPFHAKMINNSLTVDLNSWHAFVELQRTFDEAPKIYPAHTYRHSTLPVIKF